MSESGDVKGKTWFAAAAAILGLFATPSGAGAWTETVLHNFCNQSNCRDGSSVQYALVTDGSGNLYGTARGGGRYGHGLIFRYATGTGKYAILKSFCAQTNCTDGDDPEAGLIIDTDGSLYGTTDAGGKHGLGTVFRLTPHTGYWTWAVLHNFSGPNGEFPVGLAYTGQALGLPWDRTSPLFGTTYGGGSHNNGVAYKLEHVGTHWNGTVLHSFDTHAVPGELAVNATGNLFGTTQDRSVNGVRVLFRLAHGTWTETILHTFPHCYQASCSDGDYPVGRLAMDGHGNVFGVTNEGGAHNRGVVFERTAGGAYKILWSFGAFEGYNSFAGIVSDGAGHLFGAYPGDGLYGIVFELSRASGGAWNLTTLYSFCPAHDGTCADGRNPVAPAIVDASGNLYGTTLQGGNTNGGGVLFQLTNPQQPH